MSQDPGRPQITPQEPEHTGSRRDPEERPVTCESELKDRNLDKTLADSFPTSDPPSSIPDPGSESEPENISARSEELVAGVPPGSWAAISIDDQRVVATGATRGEAEENARRQGHGKLSLVQAPGESDAPLQSAAA